MARIVCQVLHRADRITFLWSEGAASFEPYHLEGAERANLLQIAAQIHAKLAHTNGSELAQLGNQLFRAVLRRDANDGSAEEVYAWLAKRIASNDIERLEFLSDAPGLIPWNVLTEGNEAGFWGVRFNLGAGRRMNALRQNPTQTNPTQLFAADLNLVEQLSAAQQPLLESIRTTGKLLHTVTSLTDDLRKGVPDVFLLLVRYEKGLLHLGADSFTVNDLQNWLAAPKEGNPDPLVILMGVGDASEQSAWQTLLGAASAAFSGLVANEALLPASQAFEVGHTLAQRFAHGKNNLGEILRTLRSEHGLAGLAFTAFCPQQMRVLVEGVPDATTAADDQSPVDVAPLPRAPYRPFAAFEAGDRALFFGREEDTLRGALTTDQAGTLGVLLHGAPGAGKTSYLQAGLLPYLEQENIGYRVLRDRTPVETPVAEKDYPILILRCTSDLAGQFADALSVFCAQAFVYTTPTGKQVTVDLPKILQQLVTGDVASTAIQAAGNITATPASAEDQEDAPGEGVSARELWIALRDHKELLGKILDAVTRSLPFELVIAIDQGEELLTLVRGSQQELRRQKALDMLMQASSCAPRCKILFAIRTQSLGEFVSLLPDGRAPADWGTFYLRPLTETEMVDALLWPTNRDEIPYCEEIPFQKYGFGFEEGLAPQIVAEAIEAGAAEQQSPLAILQAVGALLYERQVLKGKKALLALGDLKDFGSVKEAQAKYLERTLQKLSMSNGARTALRQLITKLYTSHADGTVNRDLLPAAELKNHWPSAMEPPEQVVNQAAEEQGLFEVQQLLIGGQTDVFVSLPQDSLARLGKKIAGERELAAYARTKVLDVLWVLIPLMFLVAAVTFWGTRHYFADVADGAAKQKAFEKETLERAQEILDSQVKLVHERSRPPLYQSLLTRADQALRLDNALRARDLLLSFPAMRAFQETKGNTTLTDLRTFEWKYLWRYLNSERYRLNGHIGIVTSVAVSPDSQRAATASIDGSVRIWNLSNGEIVALIAGSKTAVHAVAFAPDGKALASAGADKIVRLWDLSKLKTDYVEITKEKQTLAGHTDTVNALAFGKDDKTLASAGADKAVILWDLTTAKEKHVLKEHTGAVHTLAFSDDGKTLASAGAKAAQADRLVILWDAETGKKRQAVETPYQAVAALAMTPDGKTLCTAGVETKFDAELGMIRFWNLADGKETHKAIQHGSGVVSLACAPGKELTIASGGKDRVIRLWDVKTGQPRHKWIGHEGFVGALAFAPDGSALVSGSFDSTAKVWNPTQSSGPDVIAAHGDWVQALVLNSKNTLLASGARDGSVKLWDPKSTKLLVTLPAHKGAVTALAFSFHKSKEKDKDKDKEKTLLAVATRDEKNEGEIKIWQIDGDPKQGYKATERHTLTKHKKGVTCVEFFPSTEKPDLLISGSADKTVKLWDAEAGTEKASHEGHKDEVRCVAFSYDGKSFASGGKDALVCVYELDSKVIRKLPDLHIGSIESLMLIPVATRDDEHLEIWTGLLTGSTDQAMQLRQYENLDRPATTTRQFRAHSQPLTRVLFHALNDGLFLSSSWDGTIKFYDRSTERFSLVGHQGAVRAFVMAADQSFLASASNDGTIRIWRTAAGRLEKTDK